MHILFFLMHAYTQKILFNSFLKGYCIKQSFMIERNFSKKEEKTMKKINAKSIMIMSLAFILAACGGKRPSESSEGLPDNLFAIPSTEKTTAYGLAGRAARYQYNGLLSTPPGSMNYLKTQEALNAQHFANFIDGLLTHNEYGVLEKSLAEKVVHNADYSEFTFTVRKGVKWQHYDGTQYNATIEGIDVPQFVVPSDWVTTAKAICTYANASDLEYLIGTFVEGAEEYYWYTRVQYGVANKESGYKFTMTDYEKVAAKINALIKENSPNIWKTCYDNGSKKIEASDVANIANLSRLGIVADDENMTLTYKLIQKASYFPTLFTYSCYLPTNQYFLKEVKFSNFGTENDKILYNGPYLLSKWDETKVVYKANQEYWNKDNTITVNTINYDVIADLSSITSSTTREEFEAGRIDGFSLSKKDVEGWNNYVVGADGTGTFDNPADPRVNSRLLDTIGNMYGSNLVLARDKVDGKASPYCKSSTAESVNNTARALRLADVRRAILNSFDMNLIFDARYENLEESLRQQEKVWTYVPKGFVIDDNGNDYLTHYYEVYGQKNNMPAGDIENPVEGTAAYELKPGQTATKTLEQEEINALLAKAEQAIELFNAENPSEAITKPINLELYSLWFDETSQAEDQKVIDSLNTRLNYGKSGDNKLFNVIPTDNITNANYNTASRSGQWDLSVVQWGWGADYGDPLTFMNTYIKNGDWGDVFPYVNEAYVDNYEINEAETGLIKSDLLEEYTNLVNLGAQETDDLNARYNYFAQAEYMLIEELGIYKPQTNNGQGWSLSVSRSAGYMMPTSSYGLSNDRLTGWYILDQVMTRDERNAARTVQQQLKEAYLEEVGGAINIY